MDSMPRLVLDYWLTAINALAAESRSFDDDDVLVKALKVDAEALGGMHRTGKRAASVEAEVIRDPKEDGLIPSVIHLDVTEFDGDRPSRRPTMVLAVPCDVSIVKGMPVFSPPAQPLFPSIPMAALSKIGEDKDGVIVGTVEDADEWLKQQGVNLDIARRSGDWEAWWNASISLLVQVGNLDPAAPFSSLENDLTSKLSRGSGNCSYTLAVNVNKLPKVPSSLSHVAATMKALISSDHLEESALLRQALGPSPSRIEMKFSGLIQQSAAHFGLMDKFQAAGERAASSLDPDQRIAVLRHFSGSPLSSLVGPPGTGKTSAMRATVGDALVRPLIGDNAEPSPQMILATAATNQATTNIIESFGGASKPRLAGESVGVESRWVNGVSSYGWFAPSTSIQRSVSLDIKDTRRPLAYDKFQLIARNCRNPDAANGIAFFTDFFCAAAPLTAFYTGGGLTNRLFAEARNFVSIAEQHLSVVSKAITTRDDVENVIGSIADRLRGEVSRVSKLQFSVHEALWKLLKAGPDGGAAAALGFAVQRVLTGVGPLSTSTLESHEIATEITKQAMRLPGHAGESPSEDTNGIVQAVESILDRYPRLAAFHYAARYWEARWLLARFDKHTNLSTWPKKIAEVAKKEGLAVAIRKDMEDLLFLAPCIVATANTLPSIFGIRSRPEAAFGIADEIIVDEAGQASSFMIAPTLAFAKRAIILGDPQQLDPIWPMSTERDTAIIRTMQARSATKKIEIPEQFKMASGSAMMMAESGSNFTQHVLRYHYRCRPSVIKWNSDACYDGKLIPVRPEAEQNPDDLIPPLGYVHVFPQFVRDPKGSASNVGEASAIGNWLWNNKDEIEKKYGKPLHECVAVLTPYSLQKRVLTSSIRNKFQGIEGFALSKMLIGSVSQMQGAERPLVLFSPVMSLEGQGANRAFFDKTFNLLNVARSRTTESFIVFADPEMLSRTDSAPFGSMMQNIRDTGRRIRTTPAGKSSRLQGPAAA